MKAVRQNKWVQTFSGNCTPCGGSDHSANDADDGEYLDDGYYDDADDAGDDGVVAIIGDDDGIDTAVATGSIAGAVFYMLLIVVLVRCRKTGEQGSSEETDMLM